MNNRQNIQRITLYKLSNLILSNLICSHSFHQLSISQVVRPPYLHALLLISHLEIWRLFKNQSAPPVAETVTCVENDVSWQAATNLELLHCEPSWATTCLKKHRRTLENSKHETIQQYGIEVDWPAFEWIKKSSTPARNSRGGSNHTTNKWTNKNVSWFNFHLVSPVLWTRLTKDNSRPFHCLHLSWAEWACISMTGFPCLVIVTQVSWITPTAKSMHSDSNTPTLRSTY